MDLHTNIPVKKIEQMVQYCKKHRCAIDFDLGFLNLVFFLNKDATERGHLFILVYDSYFGVDRNQPHKFTCGATVDLVNNEFRMRTDKKLLSIRLSHPFSMEYLCPT